MPNEICRSNVDLLEAFLRNAYQDPRGALLLNPLVQLRSASTIVKQAT
jgi:hypothetical protein